VACTGASGIRLPSRGVQATAGRDGSAFLRCGQFLLFETPEGRGRTLGDDADLDFHRTQHCCPYRYSISTRILYNDIAVDSEETVMFVLFRHIAPNADRFTM
jgi:hypothetical protein